MQKFVTNFWYDTEAEEAAKLYTSIFEDSKILATSYYPDTGKEITGKDAGTVLTVKFVIGGQEFLALNGGPQFKFNESISTIVKCKDQAEIDRVWEAFISSGGEESQCGWLKDKFGVSWQIIPEDWDEFTSKDPEAMKRFFDAMFPMKKLDIAKLKSALKGE